MKTMILRSGLFGAVLAALVGGAATAPASMGKMVKTYLPEGPAAKVVTVTTSGPASAGVTVMTAALATKESGPKETVEHFGEVYAFSPSFIAVHKDEPTAIDFWNLQPDDEHDFMLADPRSNVLMSVLLPPLQQTSYVFTFHEEGLFNFYCTMHQPEMNGQILVLPALSH
jgi:plastocyanin